MIAMERGTLILDGRIVTYGIEDGYLVPIIPCFNIADYVKNAKGLYEKIEQQERKRGEHKTNPQAAMFTIDNVLVTAARNERVNGHIALMKGYFFSDHSGKIMGYHPVPQENANHFPPTMAHDKVDVTLGMMQREDPIAKVFKIYNHSLVRETHNSFSWTNLFPRFKTRKPAYSTSL